MERWRFICTLGEPTAEPRHEVIGSSACELICVGIPSVDGAADAARALVEEGVQLIELCGAFEAKGLAAVTEAVDGAGAGARPGGVRCWWRAPGNRRRRRW